LLERGPHRRYDAHAGDHDAASSGLAHAADVPSAPSRVERY
jgi:hypothetical protein